MTSAVVRAVCGAALTAVALGVLLVESAVVVAWATDARSATEATDAARTGLLAWLLAHKVPLAVPGGRFALAPLALTVVVALLCSRAGASVAARTPAATPGGTVARGAAIGLPYGLAAALATAIARTPQVRPAPLTALLMAGAIAAVAGGIGASRHVGRLVAPPRAAMLIAATGTALGTLAATGAIGVGVALVWHGGRAGELARALSPGGSGTVLLLVLCVVYVPNAVVWGASYALGTGFAVGAGSVVAPTGVQLGPLPAFPLLAALPGNGASPLPSLLLLAGPLVAGVLAGLVVVRRSPDLAPARAAAWALATGPAAAAVVAVVAWAAGGAAGPGRLGVTGPSPLLAAVAAAEWIGFGAAATAFLAARRRAR